MRRGENDLLYVDKDGLVHFPPSWTEQAKENWFANLRDKNEDETPPGMPTVYITGIYGASGNVPRVDSEWDGSLPAGLDRGSQGSMAHINRRPVWFVGAKWHDHEPPDQTERFLAEGVWEGYADRHLNDVKSVQRGDRIVIKSTYTRKHGLPFDNRGKPVSTMMIKAVGEVTENPRDGRRLKVTWKPVLPPREWYFYTYRRTVWKVQRSSEASSKADALIRFALDGEEQDFETFLKAPC